MRRSSDYCFFRTNLPSLSLSGFLKNIPLAIARSVSNQKVNCSLPFSSRANANVIVIPTFILNALTVTSIMDLSPSLLISLSNHLPGEKGEVLSLSVLYLKVFATSESSLYLCSCFHLFSLTIGTVAIFGLILQRKTTAEK